MLHTGAVISVCNLKGGSGKSTIAVNLACALQDRVNQECRLVDADRQGTVNAWAAKGELPVRVVSRVLHHAKPEERYPGMLWVSQIKGLMKNHRLLVIDLPPGLEYSLAAVTAVSDLILVPVNPSGMDFHSTARFVDLVQKSRALRGCDKPQCIIVPNRIDGRTAIARELPRCMEFGELVSPPIHMRAVFVKAFDTGQWVGTLAPGSTAHQEINHLVGLIEKCALLETNSVTFTHNLDLTGAHFRKANLSGADISGADFTQANNLTQEQISSACADAVRPRSWISLLPVLSAVFRRPGRTRKSGDFAGAEPRNPR